MDLISRISKLLEEGKALSPRGGSYKGYNDSLQAEYISWRTRTINAIDLLGETGKRIIKEIEEDRSGRYFYISAAQRIVGCLEGALDLAKHHADAEETVSTKAPRKKTGSNSHKVFLVHGHDNEVTQSCARLIERLNLELVLLVEEPGGGKTIIEKLEKHSEVEYAVVLMTPDDEGKVLHDTDDLKPRARQNVVLELGYFIGKLGRERVAALYDPSVEMPSDYHGVEYIEIDDQNNWQLKLAREMRGAGLVVDLNLL